jgi:hypothetical protein
MTLAIAVLLVLSELAFQALDDFVMLLDGTHCTTQAFPPPLKGSASCLQSSAELLPATLLCEI